MTTPHFPDTPAAYTPSEEEAPTWDQMREGGCMVIDDSLQQLAVYPGGGGCVVLMEEHCSQLHFIVIDHGLVPALITALTKAEVEAVEIDAQVTAQAHAEWKEHDRRMKLASLVVIKGGAAGA